MRANLKVVMSGAHVNVILRYEDQTEETLELDIVPDEMADFAKGFLGEGTPLAKAILGHSAGETVTYRAGDAVEARIASLAWSEKEPDENASARREESMRKALNQTELRNAINFASSFNSKWGDYDPSSLNEELDKDDDKSEKDGK